MSRGTTSGNWTDSDNSSANFTGLSFQGIKAIGLTSAGIGMVRHAVITRGN